MEKKNNNKMNKLGKWLNKHATQVSCMLLTGMMATGVVSAQQQTPTTADNLWSSVIGILSTWGTRLGIVIMVIGGILLGLGWRSDDASQKSSGINTVVAGGIVLAACGLLSFAT